MSELEFQEMLEGVTTVKEYQDGFKDGQAWRDRNAKRGELVRLRRWYWHVNEDGSFGGWFSDVESDGAAAPWFVAHLISGARSDDRTFDFDGFLAGIIGNEGDPDDPVYLQGFIEGALAE